MLLTNINQDVSEPIDPANMQAPGVKSLGYVKLNGTSASAFEVVAKSWKSLNTSNGLALLLVFREISEPLVSHAK